MPGGTTVAAATGRKMASVNCMFISSGVLWEDRVLDSDRMFVRVLTQVEEESELYALAWILGTLGLNIDQDLLRDLLYSILRTGSFAVEE